MRGIGVDIVETARFARSTDEFARLILTDNEFSEYYKRNRCIEYLATRFAAKEAAIKALGRTIGLQFIEITNDKDGKPEIQFLTTGLNITKAMVTISDAKEYVVAMVIIE